MEAEPQGTQGPSASLSSLPSLHTEKKTDTATAEPAETAQVAKEEKSSGVGKSVVQKVSALIPGLKHKKEEDKKEKEKKGTEMEEDRIAEEKEVAKMEDAEKEHDSTDKNQGGEGESETKPADADRDPHSEKSLVSEGETTKDRDSERQSLIEKPDILMSPIDLTDSAKAEHPSEKGPVQLRQDEAVQQHQVEKPDAAPTRAAEKHPAPVVLEPAVNVVALRGGDGRRAPPSSPALMGGASPTAVEDNKGAVPAGILKAAADMLRAKELPDLDGGEDATPESVAKTGEGVSEEKAEVVGNDGGSESEAGEIHGGDKKDQSFLEGLTDSLASLVQDSPTEQSESRMELHGGKSGSGEQEGGDAKALALPPLPSPTPSVSSPEEATPAQDDERRPSLAGGEGATAKQPPARGEPAVSGGESFQDWYAKQKSGAGKKDLSASNKRPTGDMKPSAYVDKTQLQALQALQKLSVSAVSDSWGFSWSARQPSVSKI